MTDTDPTYALLAAYRALEYKHAKTRALLATSLAIQKSLVTCLRAQSAQRNVVTEKEAAYLCGEAEVLQARVEVDLDHA